LLCPIARRSITRPKTFSCNWSTPPSASCSTTGKPLKPPVSDGCCFLSASSDSRKSCALDKFSSAIKVGQTSPCLGCLACAHCWSLSAGVQGRHARLRRAVSVLPRSREQFSRSVQLSSWWSLTCELLLLSVAPDPQRKARRPRPEGLLWRDQEAVRHGGAADIISLRLWV
jgi:hypothetical protein